MTHGELHPVPVTQGVSTLTHSSPPPPTQDVQTKLRDAYKKTGDEFMTNRVATQAKVRWRNHDIIPPKSAPSFRMMNKSVCVVGCVLQEYLPPDIQAQFSISRELIKNIHNSFYKLRERAEKIAERSKENATDLLMFGRELRYLLRL